MKDYHINIFYSAEAEGSIPDTETFHTNWTGRGRHDHCADVHGVNTKTVF